MSTIKLLSQTKEENTRRLKEKEVAMKKYRDLFKTDKEIGETLNKETVIEEWMKKKGSMKSMELRDNEAYALAYMLIKDNKRIKELSQWIIRY